MKKLIYGGLFLALVGIGFVGCEKKNLFNSNKDSSMTMSNFKSGNLVIPVFESWDELDTKINELHEMGEDERREYEDLNGYKSLLTSVYEVYEGVDMERLKDKQELEKYVSANSSLLVLRVNEYDETEYHPFYSDNEYSIVANEDRLFIVKDLCFKIFDDGLVASHIDDIQHLQLIRDVYASDVSENNAIAIAVFDDNELSSKSSSCNNNRNIDRVTNNRDRTKLKCIARGFQIIFNNGLVLPDINVVRTYGRIRSYKRVLWVWYHARRTISGDINYEVNYSFNSAIGTQKIEVNKEIEAKKGYSRSVFKSDLTPEYSYNVKFIEIDSEGTTPSTGNAIVNCNN